MISLFAEMSSDLELDISDECVRCLRCTVVDASPTAPIRYRYSTPFWFERGGWKLKYEYYRLCMVRWTIAAPGPFHVSVRVENCETGRIVPELSEEKHWVDKMETYCIWEKSEDYILRTLPGFRRSRVLKFVVILRPDFRSQIEDSRMFRPLVSSSVQTESHPPEAAGQSTRPNASICCPTTELQNTYDCLESLSHDFSKLLDEGLDPDVEFLCSGQSTGAHGVVVSVRSEVFASMLSSDMLEGRTKVIKIPDIEPDVFQHFLRYIYTGTLPDLTLDLALNLFEAGDRYSVMGLARRCSKYLLEHLTVDNACNVLSVADAHSDKDLKQAVLCFMVDSKVPKVSSYWTEFCGAHPILALEVLNHYVAVAE